MVEDQNSSRRKKDHIELAFKSQQKLAEIDQRFYYEPVLSGHPLQDQTFDIQFLNASFKYPIWVSSMTGGTHFAATINKNLARVCKKFGLGMGLGSCRSLLHSDADLEDFAMRKYIGDQPLYANLGIAQLENLVQANQTKVISEMVKKLQANGLIVHINPLQEWAQPEGDRYYTAPLDTIKRLLDTVDFPIIVKEVGQGMGKASLRALMQLPLQAIDFAASGGTNFSKLELLRSDQARKESLVPIIAVGHSAEEMVIMVNILLEEMQDKALCKEFIISGGVKNFLDGYYLTSKLNAVSLYGQASGFLKYARGDYEDLERYVSLQVDGYKMARSFLRLKNNSNE